MPRYIYDEQKALERIDGLKAAIERYLKIGAAIPLEWLQEYNELIGAIATQPRIA